MIAPATTLEESQQVGEEASKRGLTITNVYGGGIPLHTSSAVINATPACLTGG